MNDDASNLCQLANNVDTRLHCFKTTEIRHLIITRTGSCHFCLLLCDIPLFLFLLACFLLFLVVSPSFQSLVLSLSRVSAEKTKIQLGIKLFNFVINFVLSIFNYFSYIYRKHFMYFERFLVDIWRISGRYWVLCSLPLPGTESQQDSQARYFI